jgi:ABC-2 type transport system permease protein
VTAPLDASAEAARERANAQRRIRWELLVEIIRKDLKIKYQGSVLGFAWSLANPLVLLAIYYFAFAVILRSGVPDFAIFIAAGLLPWTAFSGAVSGATSSVVANGGLVKKVRFPLEVLPLSQVGNALVHFVLQFVAILGVTMSLRHVYSPALALVLPATVLLIMFASALGYLVAALNVRFRDTAHLVEIALLVWFWISPVVYPATLIREQLHSWYWLYFLNPMATVVATFQRAVYVTDDYVNRYSNTPGHALAAPGYSFYLRNLALGFAVASILLLVTRRLFHRMQANFVEEL